MFTGIVETVGEVVDVGHNGQIRRTSVCAPAILDRSADDGVRLGDSVAIDGVCQTVVAFDDRTFTFDSVPETLRLTNVGSWHLGRPVNVERSLAVGSRLGGHWVLGHVDGVVRMVGRRDLGDGAEIRLGLPRELAGQIAKKGSVALDGISLTVTDVDGDSFGVAAIPFTLANTTLGERRPGDLLHLETDVLAKYAERAMHVPRSDTGNTTDELLARAGFHAAG